MDIKAENITVKIDGKDVLKGQSVHATPGATLAFVGPSGCGKTTLLNVLGLLRRIDAGRVLVEGQDATRWDDRRRRRFWQQHAAFVFQDYGLIDEESVEYNVGLSQMSLFGVRTRLKASIESGLERVGLTGRGREKVSTLSGGEKQRVSLARSMFRSADVIFADEPTASLDLDNRNLVTRFLQEEAARGAAVIIATHDESLMKACDISLRLGPPVEPLPSR
ncbi:ATP-binding cassette domain-containing protein [Arthrobacter sp. B2a2-09]|uniref:ATP-binding cassette domain-containing protein n=1 Tax=Arthrobacter sp. B2a2-09 TaxID=2952822 RepID=UPI0022CD6DB7|nr:ATP-binding cassette domain-containing protein [Arthrobacter sp. B2a2-09]MCZ9883288.1 ATP-binding cassette domain-containing protein [Arthrobacter sp. B2a2-09]